MAEANRYRFLVEVKKEEENVDAKNARKRWFFRPTGRKPAAWCQVDAGTIMALSEADGKTSLTLTAEDETQDTRDVVMRTPMEEGVREIYDALAALLPSLT
jgi:hypothetical protein